MSVNPADSVDTLFTLLRDQGEGDYIGEHISQLEHCLQAAYSASLAHAPEPTILAALFHDVGQFLPDQEEAKKLLYGGQNVGRVGHEKLGEDWLKERGWPKEVTELVGSHVIAKRWLTANSQEYLDALSSASKASLVLQVRLNHSPPLLLPPILSSSSPLNPPPSRPQGGPFTPLECQKFEEDPLYKEKIALRKWDDQAKVVGLKTPDLESYREMAVRVLSAALEVK